MNTGGRGQEGEERSDRKRGGGEEEREGGRGEDREGGEREGR